MRIRRCVRGFRIAGRSWYLTVKLLYPGVTAIRTTHSWRLQVGPFLLRLARRHVPRCLCGSPHL